MKTPWIKRENFEFIEGDVLLAIKKGPFNFPCLVRVTKSDQSIDFWGCNTHNIDAFDYYMPITYPEE